MRKPFWFAQKKCWYVKDSQGKAIRLDPDEGEAYRIWQQMRDAATPLSHPRVTLGAIVEAWLAEHKSELEPQRYRAVGGYLGKCVTAIGPTTPAKDVRPSQVTAWAKNQVRTRKTGPSKPWSKWAIRDAIACVKRVYAWARDEGYLDKNPLAKLKAGKPRGRARTLSAEEHAALVRAAREQKVNGKQFALYLIASRCGGRPQQIREITPQNIHASGTCWVFAEHKTAEATRAALNVYLSPCLQTLTKILAVHREPNEPLFRQENGRPWSKDTIARRLLRLRRELGMSDDIVAYAYRHTFATEALLSGVHIATVAELLGHVDTRMVSEVYGHLDQHSEHLADAATRVQAKRLDQSES